MPELQKRDDVWVESLVLDRDSKAKYVGKTKNYIITSVSTVKDLNIRSINVGDEIEGVRIGAIECSFFSRDAWYGGQQIMWRGRWACKAGRNKEELENCVGSDGEKRFDYIYISPVTLEE